MREIIQFSPRYAINYNSIQMMYQPGLFARVNKKQASHVVQWKRVSLKCRRTATQVPSLSWENPLEKEMAVHSIFLSEKSLGQKSLMAYSPWDRKRVGYNWMTKQQQYLILGTVLNLIVFIFKIQLLIIVIEKSKFCTVTLYIATLL